MASPEELQQLLEEKQDKLKNKIRMHAEFCKTVLDQMGDDWDLEYKVSYLFTEVLELAGDMENLKMDAQQLKTMSRTLQRLDQD